VLDVTGNIDRYDDFYRSGDIAYTIVGMLHEVTEDPGKLP